MTTNTANIDRKALVAVASELNEKREAAITNLSKKGVALLTAAILGATANGTDLTKLSKPARSTIQAILDIQVSVPETTAQESAESTPEAEVVQPVTAEPIDDGDTAEERKATKQRIDALVKRIDGDEPLLARENLTAAAADMNVVMGLDPGIDLTTNNKIFGAGLYKALTKIAANTDNFSEQTWATIDAIGIGPKRALAAPVKVKDSKVSKATKAEASAKAEKTPKAAKTEKKTTTPKEPKGPGVIATIIAYVNKHVKKTFTHADLLTHLCAAFPNRESASLLNTIKTQVPGRMSNERGYVFTKDGANFKVTLPTA